MSEHKSLPRTLDDTYHEEIEEEQSTPDFNEEIMFEQLKFNKKMLIAGILMLVAGIMILSAALIFLSNVETSNRYGLWFNTSDSAINPLSLPIVIGLFMGQFSIIGGFLTMVRKMSIIAFISVIGIMGISVLIFIFSIGKFDDSEIFAYIGIISLFSLLCSIESSSILLKYRDSNIYRT